LVVIDNTNTSVKEMRFYYDEAVKNDYLVKVFRIETHQDLAYSRNTHNVPFEAIKAMHDRFEDTPQDWCETIIKNT
jgi:hypothetical protein